MFDRIINRGSVQQGRSVIRFLTLVLGLVCVFLNPTSSAHAAYQYSRSITVTSTLSIASGTQTSFPMLVSTTLSSWEPVADGGRIQNLCTTGTGIQEPCDLSFATSSANCNQTPLNFETESYTSSTGALVDWVNVPTMSAGTAIYACYGNSSVATDQSHPSSTWNSNYVAVYHMQNATGATTTDSTANNFNLTNVGINATSSGEIGGAEYATSTTAGGSYLQNLNFSLGGSATSVTMEAWMNVSNYGLPETAFIEKEPINGDWNLFAAGGTIYLRDRGARTIP